MNADGITGGAYAGYNFQPAPGFVMGFEGDLQGTGMKGSGGGLTVSNPFNGTIRARAGFAFDRFLVYGTGGLAVGTIKVANATTSDTETRAGWTLGGGLEAAITNSLVGRVEYRYTDLGSDNYATAANPVSFTSNSVLVGLGMKF
jgi:outer membrane immunogenic protein